MAYGLPSVSFAVGGVLDTLPPEAISYSYVYGDAAAFAAGIDMLLGNSEEYEKQQAVAKDWVKQFDKPAAVKKFSKLLTT
jgi:glycosyltransferase involved in cell wall biosynthesis